MTLRTSYKKLRQHRQKFKWEINSGEIRAYAKSKKCTEEFCPITAVCYAETKNVFDMGDYDKAAELLKLEVDLAKKIVSAADFISDDYFTGIEPTVSKREVPTKLRNRHLKKCVGVKGK